MKALLLSMIFIISIHCNTGSVRSIQPGKTDANRIENVKKNAVGKLPDSTEKSWINSELDSCKDTITIQNQDQTKLVRENETLRDQLKTCSDEKADYANKAANMVIFLVLSGVAVLVLVILLILVRQGVLKTLFGIGKLSEVTNA